MWIGVVADTEGVLHPGSLDVLAGMDYILHCGGIGDPRIILELSNIAPVTGVLGAQDEHEGFEPLNTVLFRKFSDTPIFVTHDVGIPSKPYQAIVDVVDDLEPKVVLFGRTKKVFNANLNDRLWFNPGSSSQTAPEPTVGILEIDSQAIRAEIVHLG